MTCRPITDQERRVLDELAEGKSIDDAAKSEALAQLVKEGFVYHRGGGYGLTGLGFMHSSRGVGGGLVGRD